MVFSSLFKLINLALTDAICALVVHIRGHFGFVCVREQTYVGVGGVLVSDFTFRCLVHNRQKIPEIFMPSVGFYL